jgi:anti-sigma B factor antagonist
VEPLGLAVEQRDGIAVVRAVGEIDVATAPQLRAFLAEVISTDRAASLSVDLDQVPFLDSTGIGVLISAHHRLAEGGGKLTLRHPCEAVARTLGIVGLDDWIEE